MERENNGEKTVCWGMIGCGDVTEVKNGPGLYLGEGCRLKAVYNRTVAKARDWSARHNGAVVCETMEELLADPEIDIVYIATPPDAHRAQALACAAAGKHVYLEKPAALTLAEGEEILQACRKSGVQAYVAQYRRGMEKFQKVRMLLEEGAVGAPRLVRVLYTRDRSGLSGWRADAARAGGGHFFETDIHTVDLMDFLLGPFVSFHVQAQGDREKGLETLVTADFCWPGGLLGSGVWNFLSDRYTDQVEIWGERGLLRFSVFENGESVRLERGSEVTEYGFPAPEHVGQRHEELIARDLLGLPSPWRPCALEDHLRSLAVACRMREDLMG